MPNYSDHENAYISVGSLQPKEIPDLAGCEKSMACATTSSKLKYSELIGVQLLVDHEETEGRTIPAAPKPALEPSSADVPVKTADKSISTKTNINTMLEVSQSPYQSAEVELVVKALGILGSPTQLSRWMKTSLPALRGQTPYSLMHSEEGREQVEAVLGRIEHGVY